MSVRIEKQKADTLVKHFGETFDYDARLPRAIVPTAWNPTTGAVTKTEEVECEPRKLSVSWPDGKLKAGSVAIACTHRKEFRIDNLTRGEIVEALQAIGYRPDDELRNMPVGLGGPPRATVAAEPEEVFADAKALKAKKGVKKTKESK